MLNKPPVLVFVLMYFIRFIIVIRFDEWFLLWVGLEINIMRFLLLIFKDKRIKNVESCYKYFFIQGIGSAIFIYLWFMGNNSEIIFTLIIIRYKIGVGPFYFWFPSVIEGIGWWICLLIIRIQKVLPLIIISIIVLYSVIFFIVIIRLLIGGFGIINQRKLKKLIAYSSINHLGWLILRIIIDNLIWLIYLVIYIIILLPLFWYLRKYNLDNLDEVRLIGRLIFVLGVLRIAGVPPITGFFLKIWLFSYISRLRLEILVFITVISVLILYIYIRLIYIWMIKRVENVIEWNLIDSINVIRFIIFYVLLMIRSLLLLV